MCCNRNQLIYILTFLCTCSFVASLQQEQKDLWYSYQFGSGYGNRKELFISKVDAVDDFKTQENILEWRSLSLKEKSFALGLTRTGVTVLQIVGDDKINDSFSTNETHTPMNATVYDASIFKYWNKDILKSEIIAVVAVDAQNPQNTVDLLWFRVTDNNKLIYIWKWSLLKKITHLNVFKLDSNYNVLIATERYENYTTSDWYEFQLGQHNVFWLKQAIGLETPTNSTAISTHGGHTFLSIPQRENLAIFELTNSHFVSYKNISVGLVSFVTSFKIGFESFIAIDGYSAGIYKFVNNGHGVEKQVVENANLHGINYWLSISICTYRDEEVLIAERSLDFVTHQSHVIQVIIHHGGKFVLHEEMTCDYYGDTTNGMNCLVEEDQSTKGIRGSAFFTVNDTLGVLVPRYEKASGLFVIHTEMKELQSPLEARLKSLDTKKATLEEKIKLYKAKKEQSQQASPLKNQTFIGSVPIDGSSSVVENITSASTTILRQSEQISNSNVEELTSRISQLQEMINEMLRELPNLPTLLPDRKQYNTLVVNGLVEVQGVSNIKDVITEFFNGATTNQFLKDIYNFNDNTPITGHKAFADLRTNTLEFNSINEMPANLLKYKSNPLVIDGDVVLDGELLVAGNAEFEKVDNIKLEDVVYILLGNKINETLQFQRLTARNAVNTQRANKFPVHQNYKAAQIDENFSLESINFESIFLPGNLSVNVINGDNFNEIVSSLCIKNIWTYIPNTTTIHGDVFVDDEILTVHLNKLKFPQEYVMSRSNKFAQITGTKVFANEVVIGELTTQGTINGVDSNNVITLTNPQKVDGKLLFADLEVTNNLKLDGEIIGTQPDTLLTKPTLLDSNQFLSNFNFQELEVTGTVTVSNTYNGSNFHDKLSEIVYKNIEQVDINSVKKFPLGLTVLQDLSVASNAINNVDLNTLIHKDTEQILNANELNGNVTFENVFLLGTFGSINITLLDLESVKLSGEQFISSEIIFEEELQAKELDVKSSLNDIPLEQYLYASGEVNLDGLNVDSLVVENLIVQENLDAKVENFDLKNFDKRRFSLTREQTIPEFSFNKSKIPNLNVKLLNDHGFKELFDLEIYSNKVMNLLLANKLKIKDLIVGNSIKIQELNGKSMNEILKNCLSTNDDQRKLEMKFQDVRLGDLVVEKFNNIDFADFKLNLVFKDEIDVKIHGLKFYFNGFVVQKYIETSAFNQISVYDILRKSGQQEIASPLVILGDVVLEGDCQLTETLNHVPINNITNTFVVIDPNTYRIKGDVVFMHSPFIHELRTRTVNGIQIDEYMQNLVYLNSQELQTLGNITFTSATILKGNLNINDAGAVNGVQLKKFKDDVVLITQDGNVQVPVAFTNNIIVNSQLEVENLYSSNIQGINISSWMDKALFMNSGKIPGELNFQQAVIETDVHTKVLNNIDMNTLIPLKSDSVIKGKLLFGELSSFKDVKVHGLVNGVKLDSEFENSVLSERIQQVQDNVIFQGNILVRESLDIMSLINEHELAKIVTLDSDQNISANYQFIDKTAINNDLIVHRTVNGIDITRWMQNGVKKSSPDGQKITNPWTLGSNLTFNNNVDGNGVINGLNIRKMADEVEYKKSFKYTIENDLVENYKTICGDINSIIDTTRKQIYSFKYFDLKHFIELPNEIEYVHHFKHQSKHYFLIKNNGCTSKLFIWMEELFTMVQEYETGLIAQIVTVNNDKGGDDVYLVSRAPKQENNCGIDGSNVWKFNEEGLILTQSLNEQILLQGSNIPNVFYAIEADSVMEYKISGDADAFVFPIQKWTIEMKNAAFLPPGLKTGLSLRNGKELMKLQREEPVLEEPNTSTVNSVTIGNFSIVENQYIPGQDGEMLLLNVGYPNRWKTMMAVATHEETSVKGKLDFIKIYEDPMKGRLFHKVPTYKPSSMVSMEFGELGETLLVFLENNKVLQIYEYKGIEGFKFRAKANVEGNQLVPIKLPCGGDKKLCSFLGIVNKNHFGLMEAVMDGDQLDVDQVKCTLR